MRKRNAQRMTTHYRLDNDQTVRTHKEQLSSTRPKRRWSIGSSFADIFARQPFSNSDGLLLSAVIIGWRIPALLGSPSA